MARTIPDIPDNLDELATDIRSYYGDGLLKPLAQMLLQPLDVLRTAPAHPEAASQLTRSIRRVMAMSPSSADVTDRFLFDLAMIQAVRDEWSLCNSSLPPSILPCHGEEWEYSALPLPCISTDRRVLRLDLLQFPGGNTLNDVNLLRYPWLYHELGHLLMWRDDTVFRTAVLKYLDERQRADKYSALALPRPASHHLQYVYHRREEAWRPSPTHRDWSHEIAIDIVALWAAGPAFLAAYLDLVEDKQPYIVSQVHPPYHLRTRALVEAARRIGWSAEISQLELLVAAWEQGEHVEGFSNAYTSLAATDVSDAVVTAALTYLDAIDLPRCTPTQFEALGTSTRDPIFGLPLLAASYHRYNTAPQDFGHWHSDQVRRIVQSVKH